MRDSDFDKIVRKTIIEYQLQHIEETIQDEYNKFIKQPLNTDKTKKDFIIVFRNKFNVEYDKFIESVSNEPLKADYNKDYGKLLDYLRTFENKKEKTATFIDYLINCKEATKDKIIETIKNKLALTKSKNVSVTVCVLALQEIGYLSDIDNITDFHSVLKNQFTDVGQRNKFNEYYSNYKTKKSSINGIDEKIKTMKNVFSSMNNE